MVDNNLDKYTIIVEEQDDYTIELNEQGPQGLRGIQGEVGPTGPQGEAATITIGKVETGDPGTLARVTNVGTSADSVLDFEIPRGDKGEAATIVVGSTTTSEPGTEANVVNSGDENMAILDFTIPRGSKGDKGDAGPQGVQGPQGPKGDKGDTGYGMPTGGTAGQILSKKSDTNYDIEWIDNNPSSLEVMYDKDNKAIKFIDSTNTVEFTINPEPSDATVVITSGTYKQIGNSITVPKNSLVEYTVSKDGYIAKTGYRNITETFILDISLENEMVTLTINPVPSNANVVLTSGDYQQSGNLITVPKNSSVEYSVSADGYATQTGTITVNDTKTVNITLTSTNQGGGGGNHDYGDLFG